MGLPRHWAANMNATKEHLAFLKPLRSISPTTFSGIRKCALKVVWQRNGSPPLLPTSPKRMWEQWAQATRRSRARPAKGNSG